MKTLLGAICLLAAATVAQTAAATVIGGTFSGVITSGAADGVFGDNGGDLTGTPITGTFTYDTAALGGPCPASTAFFGCFVSSGGMTITETIDGHTVTFPGAPLANGGGLPANSGHSGLLLYNLVGDAVNLHVDSSIGDPATVYNGYETSLALSLDSGSIPDAQNPVLSYSGGVDGPGYDYTIEGEDFGVNEASLAQLTAGNYTQMATYTFDVTSFRADVVPEPAAWAVMLLGFGGLGAALRGRRASTVAAE